jgi:hypothetical protein
VLYTVIAQHCPCHYQPVQQQRSHSRFVWNPYFVISKLTETVVHTLGEDFARSSKTLSMPPSRDPGERVRQSGPCELVRSWRGTRSPGHPGGGPRLPAHNEDRGDHPQTYVSSGQEVGKEASREHTWPSQLAAIAGRKEGPKPGRYGTVRDGANRRKSQRSCFRLFTAPSIATSTSKAFAPITASSVMEYKCSMGFPCKQ